jgi:uncharacterized protein
MRDESPPGTDGQRTSGACARTAAGAAGGARSVATSKPARIALALAIGVAGGAGASALNVPLPWMLGPLAACGIAAMAGLPLRPSPYSREVGQVVIGLAIGLRFTPAVLAATASLIPAMAVTTVYVIVVTTAAAFALKRLAGLDGKTAFFATAAAGMVEMAVIAGQRGGDPQAVSAVHAIRVSAVVVVVPLLVFAFGAEGQVEEPAEAAAGGLAALAGLLALSVVAAFVTRPLRFPNPWFMGPILVGAAAAATVGFVPVPWPLLVLAQLVLGIALGCRFDRVLMRRLPRVVASALVIAALLIAAALAGAAVLSGATSLSFATSFLALAPAGVTEMVLTARLMHLDAAAVTAFHITRIAVVSATILVTYRLFERLSRSRDAGRAAKPPS